MKILIAYDGSGCSDAALVDLRRAGLPDKADATVLAVAEIPMRVAAAPYAALVGGRGIVAGGEAASIAMSGDGLPQAQEQATIAAERLATEFPNWHITTDAYVDAAGPAIIRKAEAWNPDLIVVGSHGRSGVKRLVLGSVSQRVLHHVNYPVRIGRCHLQARTGLIRIVIGVDGSKCAKAAVNALAARNWPAGTKVRVIGVKDTRIAIATATAPGEAISLEMEEQATNRMTVAVREAAAELSKAGLAATPEVLEGIPCQTLLSEAENWAADCIFVGARGLNAVARVLLGSVSTAVSARAHCSVEVVRSGRV